jgi:hypothetical protein
MTTMRFNKGSLSRMARPLARLLACSMILVLLTVRLGSYREQVFITPVEDAIFDVAFVCAADKNSQTKPLTIKHKCTFDCDLPQYLGALSRLDPVALLLSAYVPVCSPHEVAFDIFIPPETLA